MRRTKPDIAALYHGHSNNLRDAAPELRLDHDRRPPRTRAYPEARQIALPEDDLQLEMPVGEALRRRRSGREFAPEPLALAALAGLLRVAYGAWGWHTVEGEATRARATPSAGGLYPLELYLATSAVETVPDGIYHYHPGGHRLEQRRLGHFGKQLADLTIGQDLIAQASLTVIICARLERTMWKYGQRGYRYVLFDAGHVAQNLYLAATALELSVVSIGGFFDQELAELLMLGEDEEQPIYLVCVGSPAGR